ncbi:aldolase/citrate lyase family protein [soil metagenome]
MPTTIPDELARTILARVEGAYYGWASARPGEPDRRQPVHTVYGGAHLFRADSARKLGDLAFRALREYAPDAATLAGAVGLDLALAGTIYDRVVRKLETEPVEDFRIDFEDGFGLRPDAEEDRAAVAAAREVAHAMAQATLPPFIGIRIKPFTVGLGPRAARTLDLFLTGVLEGTGGQIPDNFVVTNPKIVVPEQVAALADLFDALEERTSIEPGALKMELMVETPQSILDVEGVAALARLLDAARGRCVAAHFGVYDYTASLGITALHQDLDHPACDFARHMMQVMLIGTGVWLCDGATNVMPASRHRPRKTGKLTPAQAADNHAAVHQGWALHYRHVRHSLRHGYYQGWDLNPAQLPTRYAAVYAFFLEALEGATERLRHFVEQTARATLTGDVFDDAATGQALINFFLRGLNCGAITEEEAGATGLGPADLRARSFTGSLDRG